MGKLIVIEGSCNEGLEAIKLPTERDVLIEVS